LIRRGRGTIANVAFPKLACLRPQIGHALNPAAPAAITRLQTWIAAWANQVVDMGLLTQTAEPPDGRQLGSRQIRQAVLALVNTGRFSPGRAWAPVVIESFVIPALSRLTSEVKLDSDRFKLKRLTLSVS
jgi:hypothetical protein